MFSCPLGRRGAVLTSRAVVPALTALLALTTAAVAPAEAQYRFRLLTASGTRFDPFGFSAPVLNNGGQVAYTVVGTNGTTRIVRARGGTRTTIATSAAFSRFGDLSINDAGQVGFEGSFEAVTGEGIFRGAGGPVTTVVGTRDAGPFDFVNAGPQVNGAGRVAFIGETEVSFIDGVYAGDGGPVTPVYDETGVFDDFTGNPALNDAGQVAFVASLDAGGGGVFLGSGGAFTTVATEGVAGLDGIFDIGDPTLNNLGDVAFRTITTGGTDVAIFRYLSSTGQLTPVISVVGAGLADLGDPALNDAGGIAFLAAPSFGAQVLTTGPDLAAGRVIGTGDVLFGRTVQTVVFSREGLNNRGQLAFTAFFDDGSSGVFLASPPNVVPEPGTLALCAAAAPAALALAARARRRPRGGV